jgi:hypothetical protein
MITFDPYAQLRLWARPGTPTAASLDAAGWLFPSGAPTALQPSARTAGLALASPVVTVRSGGSVTVRVTATHPDGGAPWPTLLTFPSGRDAVRLSLQWEGGAGLPVVTDCPPFEVGGAAPVACQQADLPRVVLPGASATIPALLRAVTSGGQPLPPGTYTVRMGMYQELVGTFTGSGSTQLQVRVTA